MGYHAVYLQDAGSIEDGDHVASTMGWATFINWAAELGADFDDLVELAENGVVGSASEIEGLEQQLVRALREKPDNPPSAVLGVAQRLLEIVRDRPDGCDALAVTDGTSGGDE